jgi:hypothetical protein
MTAGQTNLLTSVSETDVTTDKDRAIFGAPAGATVVKRISICGDRHLSALISAVVDRYPVPETAAAFGMMGPVLDDVPIGVDEVIEALAADGKEHKVTFIKAGENMLGASLLTAIEGRLFPTTHPECIAAYFPKGATRKGYGIRRGSVLDIVPGYDTHTLKARVDAVLDGLPKLAELTKDDLVALPREADCVDDDGETTSGERGCGLAVFGKWTIGGGEGDLDCVYLVESYEPDDDIAYGVLFAPPGMLTSEWGSCYGRQLLAMGGKVTGFKGMSFKEAIERTGEADGGHAGVLQLVTDQSHGRA